jgi:hypothetical protein
MSTRTLVIASLVVLLTLSLVWGQEKKPAGNQEGSSSPNMSAHDMANMTDMPEMGNGSEADQGDMSMGAAHAMHSMENHHMDMGPHMKMTTLRDPKPGDEERVAKVVEAARQTAAKYRDYRLALKDGYQIFLPNVPQKQYHFTNKWHAVEAAFRFNPEHPTSLLYEKHGDDYKLVGVMYTAPKNLNEDEVDGRIPLSVAQWHEHVNFCVPPKDRRQEMWGPHPKFGLAGSITTKEDCDAAGGKFFPVIFSWMVHLYPFGKNPEDIWSVERQHEHGHGD